MIERERVFLNVKVIKERKIVCMRISWIWEKNSYDKKKSEEPANMLSISHMCCSRIEEIENRKRKTRRQRNVQQKKTPLTNLLRLQMSIQEVHLLRKPSQKNRQITSLDCETDSSIQKIQTECVCAVYFLFFFLFCRAVGCHSLCTFWLDCGRAHVFLICRFSVDLFCLICQWHAFN